jgi:prepilin-type N-terminal cleavage/methylation domain-containing protein
MKTSHSLKNRSGFTLVEIMIVVTIIGLLATLAIPSMAKARDTSRLNVIYNNLRILQAAKDQWALEDKEADGADVSSIAILNPYIRYGALIPVVNEAYVPNPVGAVVEADLPSGTSLGPYGPGAVITLPQPQ